MAFQDVLDKIGDDIIDNTDRLITPAVLRGVLNEIAQWTQDDKVDKVAGKGLSTEDYTTTEKTRLSNAIVKDLGIELRQNKGNLQAQSIVSSWNDIVGTGFYEGGSGSVSDMPPFKDTRGAYVIHQKLGGGVTANLAIQIATSYDGEELAVRSKDNGVWGAWKMILTTTDKTELINKINKFSINDIDLSDPAIWYPATKTLDLDGEQSGVLNFNAAAAIQIVNISSSSPAIITVDNASLIQEDSEVSPNLIQGGTEYTALNGNNYLAKNVNYSNNTFELYETDGTTPVDTGSTGVVTNITNLTVGAPTLIEVAGSAGLEEMDLVEISGTGTHLDGNRYYIHNLNLGANTFEIAVDTTGETWSGSGLLTQATYDENTGEISFTNGLKLEVERIVNVENGARFKFSASENNEITFTKTALSSASSGDIVGSGTLVLSGKSQVMEMLRLKDLNYMKTEFQAD